VRKGALGISVDRQACGDKVRSHYLGGWLAERTQLGANLTVKHREI
jgi:hypothetical protein